MPLCWHVKEQVEVEERRGQYGNEVANSGLYKRQNRRETAVISPLAQLVERETVNLEANGSTPLRRDIHLLYILCLFSTENHFFLTSQSHTGNSFFNQIDGKLDMHHLERAQHVLG